MSNFIDFLTQYKELIIGFISVCLTLICILVKRKPRTLDDFTLAISEVLAVVPDLIIKVEEPNNGAEKKAKVIDSCLLLVSSHLGRSLTSSEKDIVRVRVSSQIEEILSTPKKKKI